MKHQIDSSFIPIVCDILHSCTDFVYQESGIRRYQAIRQKSKAAAPLRRAEDIGLYVQNG